jgi:hypothetical protein
VQIRRLNFKRDSLEDIFLKRWRTANAGEGVSASINNGTQLRTENAGRTGGNGDGGL